MDPSRQSMLGKRPAPDGRPSSAPHHGTPHGHHRHHHKPKHQHPAGTHPGTPEHPAELRPGRAAPPGASGPHAGSSQAYHKHAHGPPGRPGPGGPSGAGRGAAPGRGYAKERPGMSTGRPRLRDGVATESSHLQHPQQQQSFRPTDTSTRSPSGSVLPADPRLTPSKRPGLSPKGPVAASTPGPSGSRGGIGPPPAVLSPEAAQARAAAAKKGAVALAKQARATGNFKECDSLLGNYLIPVIPAHLAKKAA